MLRSAFNTGARVRRANRKFVRLRFRPEGAAIGQPRALPWAGLWLPPRGENPTRESTTERVDINREFDSSLAHRAFETGSCETR